MEIITEEYEQYQAIKNNNTETNTKTNKEVNIDKEKIFKIRTIGNVTIEYFN